MASNLRWLVGSRIPELSRCLLLKAHCFPVGEALRLITEGRYDIIGFDPRGIGATKPRVTCFDSAYDYDLFKAGTILEKGFDLLPGNPLSDENYHHLVEQHRQVQALQKTEYAKCAEKMGDSLLYMGTPNVARDIVEMNRILEGDDALVNFFGGVCFPLSHYSAAPLKSKFVAVVRHNPRQYARQHVPEEDGTYIHRRRCKCA